MAYNYKSRFNKKERFVIQWLFDKGMINSLCVEKKDIDNICGDCFNSYNHSEIISKMYFGIKDNLIEKHKGKKINVLGKITIGNNRNKSKSKSSKNKKNIGNEFYKSREWRELRVQAFIKYGRKCCLCGRGVEHGVILHVDHIKPKSKYPHLSLRLDNMQILCEDCNLGKSNKYEEQWRD